MSSTDSSGQMQVRSGGQADTDTDTSGSDINEQYHMRGLPSHICIMSQLMTMQDASCSCAPFQAAWKEAIGFEQYIWFQ